MKLKVSILAAVFAAGLGASFALADGGHGSDGDHGKGNGKCTEVHIQGTIAPQTLNVTVGKGSRRLNLAPGATVQLQVGAAGQTVKVNAEACQVTVGTSTQIQVKSLEVRAFTPHTDSTTAADTTGGTTTGP
jgi:hypothetical protein